MNTQHAQARTFRVHVLIFFFGVAVGGFAVSFFQ